MYSQWGMLLLLADTCLAESKHDCDNTQHVHLKNNPNIHSAFVYKPIPPDIIEKGSSKTCDPICRFLIRSGCNNYTMILSIIGLCIGMSHTDHKILIILHNYTDAYEGFPLSLFLLILFPQKKVYQLWMPPRGPQNGVRPPHLSPISGESKLGQWKPGGDPQRKASSEVCLVSKWDKY